MSSVDMESIFGVIDIEIDAIKQLKISVDKKSFTNAIKIMKDIDGKVVITGMGKSGHIGKKIAASLASTGTPSFFMHPAEAGHGDLGMICEGDVVLAISNSGESQELVCVGEYCSKNNIKLVSITKNPNSSLAGFSDVVLLLPNSPEACPLGVAPTSSTTATLVLGDMLTVALMKAKGFTKSDFNDRHPSGKLGSTLQKITAVMHTDITMPILSDKSTIGQAILEISSKRMGCVGLVDNDGNLSGMITDGDLRKRLSDIQYTQNIDAIMTKNPIVGNTHMTSLEVLDMMNKHKITNMFIVEDSKPIGVVHIHDLIKIS